MIKKLYKTFEEARKYIRSLNLKGVEEWKEYCKSGQRPADIPAAPDKKYKGEWIDWYDWLGKIREKRIYILCKNKSKKEISERTKRSREYVKIRKENRREEEKTEYINIKDLDIYKNSTGSYYIENGELVIKENPTVYLYGNYWVSINPNINSYVTYCNDYLLQISESTILINECIDTIKKQENKMVRLYAEAFAFYFAKKKKGKVFICNSKNINKGAKLLANILGKYIVLVSY